ncbi:MAG: Bug family tripartite tricarboxylate transporter substrate binding protein, partial [Woeseiaceae bacterium]
SASFPEVPTTAEAGLPGFEMYSWLALFAPAGTPADAVRRLNEAFIAALKAPEVAAKIVAAGSVVVAGGPQALADFQQREMQKWRRVVQEAGIEPQ